MRESKPSTRMVHGRDLSGYYIHLQDWVQSTSHTQTQHSSNKVIQIQPWSWFMSDSIYQKPTRSISRYECMVGRSRTSPFCYLYRARLCVFRRPWSAGPPAGVLWPSATASRLGSGTAHSRPRCHNGEHGGGAGTSATCVHYQLPRIGPY